VNIWITKNSEVPVREQLEVQVTLGIAGGDLRAGERLPSTGEIARRFGIHANTAAAAYRMLVEKGMLEFRAGSGYFVRDAATEIAGRETRTARRVDELLEELCSMGFEPEAIIARLRRRATKALVCGLSLFEPDRDLRDILEFELRDAGFSVSGTEDLERIIASSDVVVAMFDERQKIEKFATDAKCIYLRGNSAAASLASHRRPSAADRLAVVSGWDGFLSIAKTMLLAAKVEPGCLTIRSTRSEGWLEAVNSASIVICDPLTASRLDANSPKCRVFRLIAPDSLSEIRAALGPP
jgi:GntR family transcriptional regulator